MMLDGGDGHSPAGLGTNDLNVDWAKFRGIAHDEPVGGQGEESAGALGIIRHYNPKCPRRPDLGPEHGCDLLGGVDVAATRVQEQVDVCTGRNMVKEVDERQDVFTIDGCACRRRVAKKHSPDRVLEVADHRLTLVATGVESLALTIIDQILLSLSDIRYVGAAISFPKQRVGYRIRPLHIKNVDWHVVLLTMRNGCHIHNPQIARQQRVIAQRGRQLYGLPKLIGIFIIDTVSPILRQKNNFSLNFGSS